MAHLNWIDHPVLRCPCCGSKCVRLRNTKRKRDGARIIGTVRYYECRCQHRFATWEKNIVIESGTVIPIAVT